MGTAEVVIGRPVTRAPGDDNTRDYFDSTNGPSVRLPPIRDGVVPLCGPGIPEITAVTKVFDRTAEAPLGGPTDGPDDGITARTANDRCPTFDGVPGDATRVPMVRPARASVLHMDVADITPVTDEVEVYTLLWAVIDIYALGC